MSKAGLTRVETRASVDTGERAREKSDHDERTETCPECDGTVVTRESERVCEECGLVVQETTVDCGPEWRAGSATERDERARCGSPVTETLHDKGLTTEIDWRNEDANGNRLDGQQRRRAHKNRLIQRYSKTARSREESLRDGRGEINRMCSALGVAQIIRECAGRLYDQSVHAGILPGWSREDVTTAVLHITLEQVGQPRDIEEILPVSQASKAKVLRSRKQILDEFDLWGSVVPDENDLREAIAQHIRRLVSDVEGTPTIERAATDLLAATDYAQLGNGRKPMSYAAAFVFEAGRLLDIHEAPTQQEIHDAGGPCAKTIRTAGKAIIENIGTEALREIIGGIDYETLNTIAKRD